MRLADASDGICVDVVHEIVQLSVLELSEGRVITVDELADPDIGVLR